jgi:hypothetical protein
MNLPSGATGKSLLRIGGWSLHAISLRIRRHRVGSAGREGAAGIVGRFGALLTFAKFLSGLGADLIATANKSLIRNDI